MAKEYLPEGWLMPSRPFLLDRLERRNRSEMKVCFVLFIVVLVIGYVAISKLHLATYWWIAPSVIGLFFLKLTYNDWASLRHPERDLEVMARVLPHGTVEAVARELDRDLGDPALHRTFALSRGKLTFTAHWLVVDGSETFPVLHYADCEWYRPPREEIENRPQGFQIAYECFLSLDLKVQPNDVAAVAAELESRTSARDVETGLHFGPHVRLLEKHLVWSLDSEHESPRTLPYSAITRVYNGTVSKVPTGEINPQVMVHQTFVLGGWGDQEVLRVSPDCGGFELSSRLLAALVTRAPHAAVGYVK